jgi:general secretion pathway protein I
LVNVNKIERNHQKDAITRNIAEYFSDMNIMTTPQGSVELGPYNLSWQSELIEPIKPGKSITGAPNEFMIGLYTTNISVKQNLQLITQMQLRLIGYKGEIRPPF